ncbi:hypothetical protein AB3S75_004425 [Citrus x aurantiifolia]
MVVLSVPCIEKDYGDLRDVYMWLWKTAAKKPGILNACRIGKLYLGKRAFTYHCSPGRYYRSLFEDTLVLGLGYGH